MSNENTKTQTITERAAKQEVQEYRDELAKVKMTGHPGEGFLVAGFQDGFKRGVYAGTGAIASGLNVVIGQIDNGLLGDLDGVLDSLIKLRDVAVKEAGL